MMAVVEYFSNEFVVYGQCKYTKPSFGSDDMTLLRKRILVSFMRVCSRIRKVVCVVEAVKHDGAL